MKVMKKMMALAFVGVIGAAAHASIWSAPAKGAINGCEKVAVKLGLRAAGETAVRGGAKLAVATAEREAARRATCDRQAKTALDRGVEKGYRQDGRADETSGPD